MRLSSPTIQPRPLAALLCASLLLSACGGNGSGNSGPAVSRPLGKEVADRIAKEQFVAGRFAEAFQAKRGGLTLRANPAYNIPPLTVECWARVQGKAGFNILAASHPKESSEHWELYTYAGSGEFSDPRVRSDVLEDRSEQRSC